MPDSLWPKWAARLLAARTFFLVVVAATVAMPFNIALNGGAIIGLVAASLGLGLARAKASLPRPGFGAAVPGLMALLFFLYLASYCYTDMQWLWPNLETRLALLAFPLAFWAAPPSRAEQDIAAFWFVMSISLLAILAEVFALVQYMREPHGYFFVGSSLLVPFGLHRVYLSVHTLVALVLLTLEGRAWAKGIWYRLWQLLLVLFIAVLASRLMALNLLLLGCAYATLLLLKGKRKTALVLAGTLVSAAALALSIPYTRQILTDFHLIRTDWGTPQTVDGKDSMQIRYWVWKTAQTELQNAPWHGYGGGAARFKLQDHYLAMDFKVASADVLDPHNQYLAMLLDLGYPGLAVLLLLLAAGLWQGLRLRDGVAATVFFVAAIAMVTECYLDAQKGIVFFSLMWAMLGSRTRQPLAET